MATRRKINQIAVSYGTDSRNYLYEKYQREFSYFLNPASAGTGNSGIGSFHIRDNNIYCTLKGILDVPMNSVTLLEGKKGIGKTAALIDALDCENNGVKINEKDGTITISVFFHRFVPEQLKDSAANAQKITNDMIKVVFAASRALEKKYPQLKEWFFSETGKDMFLSFIEQTNAKALINIEEPDETRSSTNLMKNAYLHERLIYAASKIKLYLADEHTPIWRLLIVVDGLESLDNMCQDIVTQQFLRFFHCMGNYPYDSNRRRVCTNLLFAMRPDTHQRMRNTAILDSDSALTIIRLKNSINLTDYFKKKLDVLPDDIRSREDLKWDDSYGILRHLCTKYESKYSSMIMGLAGLNVREALHICSSILSSVWVTKDFFTDGNDNQKYVFNNISVIRSIACGDRLVYSGSDIIPNVLFNNQEEDNTLISLYLIAYFVPHTVHAECRQISKDKLWIDFKNVFGESLSFIHNFYKRVQKTEQYLEKIGIIETEGGVLTLSSKGMQIWEMLGSDSVLAELFFEDVFKPYSSPEEFKSSYELVQLNLQQDIFFELLTRLEEYFNSEKDLIEAVKKNGTYGKYIDMFNSETMVGHILKGIKNSIDFSGKYNNSNIFKKWSILNENINALIFF